MICTYTLQFLITDPKMGSDLYKSTDDEGNTVLHITAKKADLESLQVLINLKVEGGVQNAEDKTPMHLAAEAGHHV